ncbi:MAG: type II secretion system protein [Opitutae bacterium]|nr:type II secretion system protein [Opitutae bacterium]
MRLPPSNALVSSLRVRGRRAFTLIEVLVALAIFAFAGVVLIGAFVNVLNAQQAALQRDNLASVRRLVHTALWSQPDLAKVEEWNDLELPDRYRARWQAAVTPTDVADLFDVTLQIELTSPDGGALPAITEDFRLLRPTWSQPADREALRAAARDRLAQRTNQ